LKTENVYAESRLMVGLTFCRFMETFQPRGWNFMPIKVVDLATYRLEKAKEDLVVSKNTLEEKHLAAVTRSYYAMFHATRALLAWMGLTLRNTLPVSVILSKTRLLRENFPTLSQGVGQGFYCKKQYRL
jgi:hypothetical protein